MYQKPLLRMWPQWSSGEYWSLASKKCLRQARRRLRTASTGVYGWFFEGTPFLVGPKGNKNNIAIFGVPPTKTHPYIDLSVFVLEGTTGLQESSTTTTSCRIGKQGLIVWAISCLLETHVQIRIHWWIEGCPEHLGNPLLLKWELVVLGLIPIYQIPTLQSPRPWRPCVPWSKLLGAMVILPCTKELPWGCHSGIHSSVHRSKYPVSKCHKVHHLVKTNGNTQPCHGLRSLEFFQEVDTAHRPSALPPSALRTGLMPQAP